MKIARLFRNLAFLAVLIVGGGSIPRAFGNDHFYRGTAYSAPYATAWVVPTSYMYPTSYVWPTAYYTPTVYSPSYVLSPTSYVLPRYFAATSYAVSPASYYLPTSAAYYWPSAYYEPTVAYFMPTVADYPVVAASNACQEAPTRIVRATPSAPPRSQTPSEPAPAAGRGKPPEAVNSQPAGAADGSSVSSRVDQNGSEGATASPEAPAAKKMPPQRLDSFEDKANDQERTPLSAPPADEAKEKQVSPPNPPAADPDPAKKAADTLPAVPTPADGANPVVVPLDLPPLGETTLRRAQKPVFGVPAKPAASVLHGVVKSGDTGALVEGASLTAASRSGQASDRAFETDAYGRFAVSLQDGNWDVRVTMPSGRVYVVSRLTVSSGKIVDDLGRDIPSLIITR